jgi:hypothetical protein
MTTNQTGLLEKVLTCRYGAPECEPNNGMIAKYWRRGDAHASILYFDSNSEKHAQAEVTVHSVLYGDCCGGKLIGGALKIATLRDCNVWDLYNLCELSRQPEVLRARTLLVDVEYFMDAANVWFYGHRNGHLYVYDSAADEVYELGTLEHALSIILDEWEAVKTL